GEGLVERLLERVEAEEATRGRVELARPQAVEAGRVEVLAGELERRRGCRLVVLRLRADGAEWLVDGRAFGLGGRVGHGGHGAGVVVVVVERTARRRQRDPLAPVDVAAEEGSRGVPLERQLRQRTVDVPNGRAGRRRETQAVAVVAIGGRRRAAGRREEPV